MKNGSFLFRLFVFLPQCFKPPCETRSYKPNDPCRRWFENPCFSCQKSIIIQIFSRSLSNHRLRHTVANQMMLAGGGLKILGAVIKNRSILYFYSHFQAHSFKPLLETHSDKPNGPYRQWFENHSFSY